MTSSKINSELGLVSSRGLGQVAVDERHEAKHRAGGLEDQRGHVVVLVENGFGRRSLGGQTWRPGDVVKPGGAEPSKWEVTAKAIWSCQP